MPCHIEKNKVQRSVFCVYQMTVKYFSISFTQLKMFATDKIATFAPVSLKTCE